jgi:hypothetical protein
MASYDIVRVSFFCYTLSRGDDMSITQFIKSRKELSDMPFLVVFRVIQLLKNWGMIKELEGGADVG